MGQTKLIISPPLLKFSRVKYDIFRDTFDPNDEIYCLDEAIYLGYVLHGGSFKNISYIYQENYATTLVPTLLNSFYAVYPIELISVDDLIAFYEVIFIDDKDAGPENSYTWTNKRLKYRLYEVGCSYSIYDMQDNRYYKVHKESL